MPEAPLTMPQTHMQYIASATTPAPDVAVSSLSVPVTPLQHPSAVSTQPLRRLPSAEELSHLCRFFVLNLIAHIPVVAESDVGDFGEMQKRNKRPLAYSMAYVAARFVPGCRSIRAMLVPEILSILKTRFDHSIGRSEEQQWTLLQALAVLSTWSPWETVELDTAIGEYESDLSRDALRASMETLARRWSLHRSGEEVARMQNQKHDGNHIRQSFAFRKYCYWLWLFGSAHFQSLLTRTPPTVEEDATIRRAAQLLHLYADDKMICQILANVELSLIWSQAKLNDCELGEWWCSMPHDAHAASMLSVLKCLDEASHLWHRKWARADRHPSGQFAIDVAGNSSIELSYRFTRFFISVHVNRLFHTSSSKQSVAASAGEVIAQSVGRALSMCHLILELSPLKKSSVRFVPESTFSMIAFACEWVIRAKDISVGVECVQPIDLRTVSGVAELMVDLSIDNNHSARTYGEGILAKLQQAAVFKPHTRPAQSWSPHTHPHHQREQQKQPWETPSPSHMSSRTLFDVVNAMDEVWPVRSSPIQGGAQSTRPPLGSATAFGDHSNIIPDYNGSDYFQFDATWSIYTPSNNTGPPR
ncbi:uncharacterized protein A1O9_05669 [Exophiala aquamarina CBS 119918]|uniref:Transcription factor domain-containing protein n=1 Tax=Exophiala aquamarina CBS 119918 TaxID=1182545 RepID=A0A072PCE0_9EURO|nr:uncharacterized protein A1O9_05669 [Exophiala aquamarina CBS 119918]KEF57749.1 hypothetical protein A1O9_05669 [Exophiala aquamarina CBS 119918]